MLLVLDLNKAKLYRWGHGLVCISLYHLKGLITLVSKISEKLYSLVDT